MKFRTLALIATLLLCACNGDGDGTDGEDATAGPDAPTAIAALDPNVFSALVLGPEDVPPGLVGSAAFNPSRAEAISFVTAYRGNGQYIQSQVGFVDNDVTRQDDFIRIRQGASQIIGGETNYDLPGADLAYAYRGGDPNTAAVLAFKGEYFVNVLVQATDPSAPAEVTSQESLDRYTQIVWRRFMQFLNDPTSVTPIPGAPRFEETPAAAATPTP
jgi:hypothetical protein